MALEKTLEKKCRLHVERGYAHLNASLIKFVSNSKRGFPDRLLLASLEEIPIMVWVELKKPGGVTSDLQDIRIEYLRSLGFSVHVVDNFDTFTKLCDQHLGAPK